jgi:hypothetical protein
MKSRAVMIATLASSLCAACHSDRHAVTEKEKKSEPPAASGTQDWRQDFTVKKDDLGPTGSNPFMDLTPGTVHKYKEGKTTLTITVLNDTKVVDGVTTRVIEEREEENGRPLETSRNFFAFDRKTGDIYYFGEEVDIFKNGKATGHPGAWQSGSKGAKFGLAIPAKPRVGDRYYQESAPDVAMDRAEVVGLDDTIKTPAGTFQHCLHVRETTPLESDVGHKWYAPGVGLVQDDELVLTSRTPKR